MPPAPARFSATTCLPSRSPSFCAASRATMSTLPPGANGMISRSGFDGYSCAAAGAANARSRAKALSKVARI